MKSEILSFVGSMLQNLVFSVLLIVFSINIYSQPTNPAAEFDGRGIHDGGILVRSNNDRAVYASSIFSDAVYGFSLYSGVTGRNTATSGVVYGVRGWSQSPDGRGVYGENNAASGSAYGVYGLTASSMGNGLYGLATHTSGNNYGAHGISYSSSGAGVYGENSASSGSGARGVYGRTSSNSGSGVHGLATSDLGTNSGVSGTSLSPTGRGVIGFASSSTGTNYGVYGKSESTSGRGVYGEAAAGSGTTYGIYGKSSSSNGRGVLGSAPTYGVYGVATASSGSVFGIYGMSNGSSLGIGVYGTGAYHGVSGRTSNATGTGVFGYASSTSGVNYGVYGESDSPSGYGVYSEGNAYVNGTFDAAIKNFMIDHPKDPTGKYLYHSVVESMDMMNIYNGTIVLDVNGKATVTLPEWFESLNQDYRYQLTPIDAWAPLYIAGKVKDNQFKIAGGEPEMEVSWQVTGIRHDPYAEQNRTQVEVIKPPREQGTYLHPEVYGMPAELRKGYNQAPK